MNSITKFFNEITIYKALALALSPLLLMWSSMYELIVSLVALITIDMYLGAKVFAKENNQNINLFNPFTWQTFKSGKWRLTVNKAKDYFILLVAAFIVNTYVIAKTPIVIFGYSLQELILISFCIIETWSIGENFKKLRGYNIFEFIFKFVKDKDWKKSIDSLKDAEKKE
jgi:hypothetical protein